jgi:hypothetical protein
MKSLNNGYLGLAEIDPRNRDRSIFAHSGREMSNLGRSGYVGGPENWREFLACWDREILDSVKLEGAVSSMERHGFS